MGGARRTTATGGRTGARDRSGSMARLVCVFLGGATGALARYAIGLWLGAPSGFPLATLVVNVTGAFGLGLAGVLLNERLPSTRYARPLVSIGFFGAYTTFSTMALEGVKLLDAGRTGEALLYWILTLILGQAAGVYGMWLGRIGFERAKEMG